MATYGAWGRGLAAIAVVALAIAGCASESKSPGAVATAASSAAGFGASAAPVTTAPAATPEPTPTPSPSVSVADAFAYKAKGGIVGAGPMVGTMTAGTVQGTITGRYAMNGADSQMSMQITLGTTVTATESATVGGKTYSKAAGKPWFEAPQAGSNGSLSAAFAGVTTLTDAGVQTVGTATLHKLEFANGPALDAKMFGLENVTGFAGTLHLWAKDDGTPAGFGMSATWQQAANGSSMTVGMTFEVVFDQFDGVRINAPDVWTVYTSAKRFNVAVPADWTLDKTQVSKGYWNWRQPEANHLLGVYSKTYSFTVKSADWIAAARKSIKKLKAVKISRDEKTTIAGLSGQLFEYEYTNEDGNRQYGIEIDAAKSKTVYAIVSYSLRSTAEFDHTYFDLFAANFATK